MVIGYQREVRCLFMLSMKEKPLLIILKQYVIAISYVRYLFYLDTFIEAKYHSISIQNGSVNYLIFLPA